MRKILFLIILIFTFSSSTSFAAKEVKPRFKDVPKSHVFYKEINYLVEKGIISGYSDGTFKPANNLNLIETLILLTKANGTYGESNLPDHGYTNIPKKYNDLFSNAVKQGIIDYGHGNIELPISEMIDRKWMAFYFSSAFHMSRQWEEGNFKDVGTNGDALPFFIKIESLASYNITKGYSENLFRPNEKITRGQFCAFLYRYLTLDEKIKNPLRSYKKLIEKGNFNGIVVSLEKPTYEYVKYGNNEVDTFGDDGYTHFKFKYKLKNISKAPVNGAAFKLHFKNVGGVATLGYNRTIPVNTEVEGEFEMKYSPEDERIWGKPFVIEFNNDKYFKFFSEPHSKSLLWKVN